MRLTASCKVAVAFSGFPEKATAPLVTEWFQTETLTEEVKLQLQTHTHTRARSRVSVTPQSRSAVPGRRNLPNANGTLCRPAGQAG